MDWLVLFVIGYSIAVLVTPLLGRGRGEASFLQQFDQLLYLLRREVLLLDEEVDEVCCRATEEGVLHILQEAATVLVVLDERIESVLLAYGLAGNILLLAQDAKEGEHGVIGRLGLGELLQHLIDRSLLEVPQDVHYLQLSTGEFVGPFHYS